MVKEKIEIETIMKDHVTGVVRTMNQSIQELGFGMQKATTNVSTMNAGLITQSKTITKNTKGLKKFKFEWLGVMFAGMAIARIFGGIIRKQTELWGISEGLSALWAIVMAPVMAILSDWFWVLFDVITSQSEAVQMLIGIFVVLAAAFGTIIMVLGQMGLAWFTLLLLFPKIGPWLVKVGGLWGALGKIITGLLGPIGIIIAVVIALAIGMYLAWKNNFLGMKKTVSDFIWGVKRFFGGFIDIIKGILMIVKGLFTGDFELIKEGIIKIFKGLWKVISGGFVTLMAGVVAVVTGALMIIHNIIKAIIDGVGWVVGKIGGWMGIGEGGPAWEMPSLQYGGLVKETGPHLLHKGETVTPTGGGAGSMVFNTTVNANIASDYDVKRLASELSKEFSTSFERELKMRGSV